MPGWPYIMNRGCNSKTNDTQHMMPLCCFVFCKHWFLGAQHVGRKAKSGLVTVLLTTNCSLPRGNCTADWVALDSPFVGGSLRKCRVYKAAELSDQRVYLYVRVRPEPCITTLVFHVVASVHPRERAAWNNTQLLH